MRVLHILSGDLWAGAEVQAHSVIRYMASVPGLSIAVVLLNEGELAARLRADGISVTVIPESELGVWSTFVRLRRELQAIRPHVVHTHRYKENVLGSLANLFTTRAHCVQTVHGAPESRLTGLRRWRNTVMQVVEGSCGRWLFDAIVAVAPHLEPWLVKRFGSKVVTIQNGIDATALEASSHAQTATAFDASRSHVALVGRLTGVKRPDLFVRTAHWLIRHDHSRDWEFHIFGDGKLLEETRQLIRQLGLQEHVRLHGHQPRMAPNLRRMQALVMCSDHEGLPMTILEAMALGVPVVAHRVGGLIQLLREGACGWPVESQQAEAYAAALQQVFADPGDARTRCAAARAMIQERYSIGRCGHDYVDLYRRLAPTLN